MQVDPVELNCFNLSQIYNHHLNFVFCFFYSAFSEKHFNSETCLFNTIKHLVKFQIKKSKSNLHYSRLTLLGVTSERCPTAHLRGFALAGSILQSTTVMCSRKRVGDLIDSGLESHWYLLLSKPTYLTAFAIWSIQDH